MTTSVKATTLLGTLKKSGLSNAEAADKMIRQSLKYAAPVTAAPANEKSQAARSGEPARAT
jgi:hypothetical protein